MSAQDFIADLLNEVDLAVQPLAESLVSIDAFSLLLADFGWTLAAKADYLAISAAFNSVSQAITTLDQHVTSLNAVKGSGSNDQLANVINAVVDAIQALVIVVRALEGTNPTTLPSPLDQADFWKSFPEQLVDALIYDYVEQRLPVLFGILRFLGIFSEESVSPASPLRSPYVRRGVHWDRIPKIVTQPQNLFADVYGWGKAFDHQLFIFNLQRLAAGFRSPAELAPPLSDLDDYYDPGTLVRSQIIELRVPLYWAIVDDGTVLGIVNVSVVILPIPPIGSRRADPAGFALFPQVTGKFSTTNVAGIDLSLSGGFETNPIRTEIRPGKTHIAFVDPLLNANATLNAHPAGSWTLLGNAKSSRIELAKAHISLLATIQNSKFDTRIEIGLDGLKLVVDFGEGDGFLQKLLGSGQKSLDLSTTISWSSTKGFGFSGQAALESNIPVHLTIADVLAVDAIYIAMRQVNGTNKAALQIALTGGLNIGPVAAIVDRVGLQLEVEPRGKTDPPGNLGTLDLAFSFKPPNGLGLLIDAGAVVGGGSITFYPDKGQYWGWLELKLENIQIKAIGLLDTHLPDGSKGYSFLIIITTDFTPLQLGFGFTLNGVGGLAGINRTMLLDVLRGGLRNHALNAVLFPPDPVRNASQIISDLRAIFPPVDGRYVFGPMIEIGWGVPTIISASLGVLLELPAPVRLTVIGQIKAVLPTDKTTLVIFHMDILGSIDFGAKKLWLDGTIYDSRIVVFPLVGDMALRLDWGSNPNFLCSVGGFHPRFQPPPNFPALKRLTCSIGNGDQLRLSLSSYQAFTSNTVQLGADFELRANIAGFSIHGFFSFDALFIFSPSFLFTAEMKAGVEVRYKGWTLLGVDLDLLLSGPTPWHAHGTGSINILGVSISIPVDVTFGDGTQVTLPRSNPLDPLLEALRDVRNWNAILPAGTEQMVSLSAVTADASTILMHPLGLPTVHQSVVPLGVTITKFGEAAPAEADYLDISSVTFEGSAQSEISTDYLDYFASAHFSMMTDAQKLAAPSYTQMKAGVTIGTGHIAQNNGDNATLQLQYDTYIVDNLDLPADNTHHPYALPVSNLQAFLRQGAAELSLVRATGNAKYAVPGTVGAVQVLEPKYMVASTDDLSNNTSTVTKKTDISYFEATSALRVYLLANPGQAGKLQVMPLYEAVTP